MAKPPPQPSGEADLRVAVGLRLRRLREAKGYHDGLQARFANKVAGVTKGTWNAYERGENLIPVATALKLKRLYSVPIDWIYDGDSRNLPFELSLALGEVFDSEQH